MGPVLNRGYEEDSQGWTLRLQMIHSSSLQSMKNAHYSTQDIHMHELGTRNYATSDLTLFVRAGSSASVC